MRVDYYKLIRDSLDVSVPAGFARAFKHTSRPSDDAICASIIQYAINGICEYIDFDDPYTPTVRVDAADGAARTITCPECGEFHATMREYDEFLVHLADCLPSHFEEVRLLHKTLGERITACDAMVDELNTEMAGTNRG